MSVGGIVWTKGTGIRYFLKKVKDRAGYQIVVVQDI